MLKLSKDWKGPAPVFEFDPDSIPQCQVNSLMEALLQAVREFYAQPGARERYQEWISKPENKSRVERLNAKDRKRN